MSIIRGHFSALRWRAANGRTKASNAWYRTVGRRVQGARTAASNRKNRRIIERGKAPRRDRVAAEIKSRTPIYRNRVNPAHGNKHREDARLHRAGNESLARMKANPASAERSAALIFGTRPRDAGQERVMRKERARQDREARTVRAPAAPARVRPVRPPLNSGAERRAAEAGRQMHGRQAPVRERRTR